MDNENVVRLEEVLSMKGEELILLAQETGLTLDSELDKISIQTLLLKHLGLVSNQTQSTQHRDEFIYNIPKFLPLLPSFDEGHIEDFFQLFERIAVTYHWPRQHWYMFFPHVLKGKAASVFLALDSPECTDYNLVKRTIFSAYQKSKEHYRQEFRQKKKTQNQTYLEFSKSKEKELAAWLRAENALTFESLKSLILKENFHSFLSENQVRETCRDGTVSEMASQLDDLKIRDSAGKWCDRVNKRPTMDQNLPFPERGFEMHNGRNPENNATNEPPQGRLNRPYQGRYGHDNPRFRPNQPTYHREIPDRRDKYFCNFCQKSGHTENYCFDKNRK